MAAQSSRTREQRSIKGRSRIVTEERGSFSEMLAVLLDHLQTDARLQVVVSEAIEVGIDDSGVSATSC